MRVPLLRALLLVGVAALTIRPARAETLTDMARKLDEYKRRIQLWVNLAERDPDLDVIDTYSHQQEEDFKKPKAVKAEDLVKIMTTVQENGVQKDQNVRLKAFETLQKAASATFDPDLAGRVRNGQTSRRGQFARATLIDHLKNAKDDRNTRTWVQQILLKWFTANGGRNFADIQAYNHDDPKTWAAAAKAWAEVARDN